MAPGGEPPVAVAVSRLMQGEGHAVEEHTAFLKISATFCPTAPLTRNIWERNIWKLSHDVGQHGAGRGDEHDGALDGVVVAEETLHSQVDQHPRHHPDGED